MIYLYVCCHFFFSFVLFWLWLMRVLLFSILQRSAELGALHLLVTVLLCAFGATWLLSRPQFYVMSWFCCICRLNKTDNKIDLITAQLKLKFNKPFCTYLKCKSMPPTAFYFFWIEFQINRIFLLQFCVLFFTFVFCFVFR